jgi:hypothetical protein
VAQALDTGETLDVAPASEEHQWLRGGYLAVVESGRFSVRARFDGSFEVPDVLLEIGENVLVARATDVASGLVSPDSEPVSVTLSSDAFPDLEVTEGDLLSVPLVPRTGEPVSLVAHVRNRGTRGASDVAVRVRVADALGGVPVDDTIAIPTLAGGARAPVVVPGRRALPDRTAARRADPTEASWIPGRQQRGPGSSPSSPLPSSWRRCRRPTAHPRARPRS